MKPFLFLFFITFCLLQTQLTGQIISGPMLGYNTHREVAIWVQCSDETPIELAFFLSNDSSEVQTIQSESNLEKAYTHTLILIDLKPGKTYTYQIFSADTLMSKGNFTTQSHWFYQNDPPDFNVLLGSCAYVNDSIYDRPGTLYGKGTAIFESMSNEDAELMLWLGDNIYLRPSDWTSLSGMNYRYTHFKSQVYLQKLWKKMHHYAIWDDHDYGPNDGDRSFINKRASRFAFENFWANLSYGFENSADIRTQFSYNDIDFFLLDNRTYRSPNERDNGAKVMLGKEQIQWLMDGLVFSKASFKIVLIGGQVLSPAAIYENYANYAEERELLLELIKKENIKNVVFLSGDRHKTELSKVVLGDNLEVYDYTCSPLSSKAYNSVNEGNSFRVEGTHVAQQNYGKLVFEGPIDDRKVILKNYDSSGKLLWEYTISSR